MRAEPELDRLGENADVQDVTVIGGGALGCAMAWEASSRGLATALLEREDFGWAASANSLRIVHGGLRYLQKMDLRRARRSTGERSAMLRIAPHLVEPLRCAIPAFRSWTRGRAALGVGLAFNAVLTLDRNRHLDAERRLSAGGMLPLREIAALAPGIPTSDWTGGAYWHDAMMIDSERLCLAFAMSAKEHGARILNHAEAVDIRRSGPRENTVRVRDRLAQTTAELHSRVVIDCRGCLPSAAGSQGTNMAPPVSGGHVKGVNLVLDLPPAGCAIGFPARDAAGRPIAGRLFFAVPYHGALAVGTWYFPVGPDEPTYAATTAEVERILEDLRASTHWQLDATRVLAVHAGLLPRAADADEPLPADRPVLFRERDDEHHYGVWRVATEKWTTVRHLAETAIDRIACRDDLPAGPSRTRSLPLAGAPIDTMAALREEVYSACPPGLDDIVIERLVRLYGRNAFAILHRLGASPEMADRMPDYPAVTRAEVAYSVTEEMPYTLGDLVLRRLGLGATGCPSPESLSFAAGILGSRRDWSDLDRSANIESVRCYEGFPRDITPPVPSA